MAAWRGRARGRGPGGGWSDLSGSRGVSMQENTDSRNPEGLSHVDVHGGQNQCPQLHSRQGLRPGAPPPALPPPRDAGRRLCFCVTGSLTPHVCSPFPGARRTARPWTSKFTPVLSQPGEPRSAERAMLSVGSTALSRRVTISCDILKYKFRWIIPSPSLSVCHRNGCPSPKDEKQKTTRNY